MAARPPRPLLRLHGVGKHYAAPVLSNVAFDVQAGEVHALVGANGAGKSTLAHIISGLTQPAGGTMELAGRPYAPHTKGEAEQAGVQIVLQELNLISPLSVAENLFLNRLPRRAGFVDYPRLHAQARQALATVGLDGLDPATPVHTLGVGRQQLVEIAAALARPCRLLILDEPTAALTDPEIARLFEHIRRLQEASIGVIYVSHRMEEIRRIAVRVTVLRDGRVVATRPAVDLSVDAMVALMVGGEGAAAPSLEARSPGPVALRVEGLCRGKRVRDVSFEVRQGEILGIAGLVGAGRTETLRAVFGADPPEAGTVRLGHDAPPLSFRQPREAVRAGLGLVPEDRKQQGLLLPLSVRVNTTLAHLKAVVRHGGWIHRARERTAAARLGERLQVRSTSVEQPVVELSGGNQQKVLIGRWLMRRSRVLLFDEPTRGIDVAAKQTVYRLLGELAAQGTALVVVSSELRELMALCDRIAVMSAGRLVATFTRGAWTEDQIMAAAFSGYLARPDEEATA